MPTDIEDISWKQPCHGNSSYYMPQQIIDKFYFIPERRETITIENIDKYLTYKYLQSKIFRLLLT